MTIALHYIQRGMNILRQTVLSTEKMNALNLKTVRLVADIDWLQSRKSLLYLMTMKHTGGMESGNGTKPK